MWHLAQWIIFCFTDILQGPKLNFDASSGDEAKETEEQNSKASHDPEMKDNTEGSGKRNHKGI